MMWGSLLDDKFFALLQAQFPEQMATMTLEQLATWLADHGTLTNHGNRYRLDEDGGILNPDAAIYPEPK